MKASWKLLYINAYLCNLEKWYCCCPVAKSCNPMDCSIPGFPVLHCLLEFPQVHVHWVGDAIQPSHPLLPSSPFAFSLSRHQGLFQWAGSWYRGSCVQSRNRDTDIENKCMDIRGKRWWDELEIGIDIYTLLILCMKQINNENMLHSTGNSTQCPVET